MAEQDDLRRLARLRTSAALSTKSDAYLITQLEDALSVFLEYTHRPSDLGAPIDSLVCDIAACRAVAEGAEGTKKAKDGDMEREWPEGGIPASIEKRLKSYRRVVGTVDPDGEL